MKLILPNLILGGAALMVFVLLGVSLFIALFVEESAERLRQQREFLRERFAPVQFDPETETGLSFREEEL